MAKPLDQEQINRIAHEVKRHAGNYSRAAEALGVTRHAVARAMRKVGIGKAEDLVEGRVRAPERKELELPASGHVNRYIFTCAQNNTHVHKATWQNLLAFAEYYGAQVFVSRFAYQKEAYGAKSVKPGKAATAEDKEDLWYAPEIEPYAFDEGLVVAPGLVFCGEMNISPTAVRPLSGLESYTGRKSGIFPHPKIALESIPSNKFEPTKFNYTTGTVTLRNYVAKKAGLKAEFHHCFGGLLVEVDSEGSWWCRQLIADSEGTIYDLTTRAKGGKITDGHRVKAINWGDIHVGTIPDAVFDACWGLPNSSGSRPMIYELKPEFQFFHDLYDFRSQNHHDRKNPHARFAKYVSGASGVMEELKLVVDFMRRASGASVGVSTIVVDSNHDNAFTRWLREADYRDDPANALVFLRAQLAVYEAIARGDKDFHLLEWQLNHLGAPKARFLRPDESFVICHDANGGIECGMHGHVGPNGSRGSAAAFSRMGRKSNIGHTHSAAIYDGTYVAGVVGSLDQGYNAGPSSWSHSSIVTYPNGKRAIITIWEGRWRA